VITVESARGSYARALTGSVTLRRLTGTGANQTRIDAEGIPARVMSYMPEEMAGAIQQGDQRAYVLVHVLEDQGWPTPIRVGDVCIVDERKTTVMGVDNNTRKVGDTIIVAELQLRGA
jgi:hypothetical protein